MTDEELDQARADEAIRIGLETWECMAVIAARLAREGWMPVDPLLIEAREVAAAKHHVNGFIHRQYMSGSLDDSPYIELALAALKRGIEIGKEKAGD